MYLLGFSLDNLVDGATLAVGFVVTTPSWCWKHRPAHRDGGATVRRGAEGAREIGFTIVSMTRPRGRLHPGVAAPGLIGRLFREFAVTIAVAIWYRGSCRSRLPMLCARF
jgi:multidrug efflux pump subunit AcrB